MSRIYISGWGAVSPAGWSAAAMIAALERGEPIPEQPLERPGWSRPLRARQTPPPAGRLPFAAHPRLRRASPITHYAASAALEAAAPALRQPDPRRRLGLIMCLQSGCVQYTHRFFKEAIEDQSTASPLLFPETVFAAPASHVAVLLENATTVDTVLGDPAAFAQGLAMAADGLLAGKVDACLVVGSEEVNWLRADALWHLDHAAVISGGAGALLLTREPLGDPAVELAGITSIHSFLRRRSRSEAALAMRQEMNADGRSDLLCDGLCGSRRADAPELAAWQDWSGPRLSPKRILGEGLMAASAWQCVAACQLVAQGKAKSVCVSLVGCNQHAVGARFKPVA